MNYGYNAALFTHGTHNITWTELSNYACHWPTKLELRMKLKTLWLPDILEKHNHHFDCLLFSYHIYIPILSYYTYDDRCYWRWTVACCNLSIYFESVWCLWCLVSVSVVIIGQKTKALRIPILFGGGRYWSREYQINTRQVLKKANYAQYYAKYDAFF